MADTEARETWRLPEHVEQELNMLGSNHALAALEQGAEAYSDDKEARKAFGDFLDRASHRVPAVAEQRVSLQFVGNELIHTYGLTQEFFGDNARALVFAAIASRMWSAHQPEEREFLESAFTLLAAKHSAVAAKELYGEKYDKEIWGSQAERQHNVLGRYANAKLSVELKMSIEDGHILGGATRLYGSTATERDYEVRVLDVATDHSMRGVIDPGLLAKKHELFENRQKLITELGGRDLAVAFASVSDKRRILYVDYPTAIKLMRPGASGGPSDGYKYRDYRRDVALVGHELGHVKGRRLTVDYGTNFGLTLEESRAEMLSGDQLGYEDVKRYGEGMSIATGKSLREYFADMPLDGDPYEVYADLANDIGTDRLLEVLLLRPSKNLGQPNKPIEYATRQHEYIARYLGGYEGVLGRLINDQIVLGRGAAVEWHTMQFVEALHQWPQSDVIEAYCADCRLVGLSMLADLVENAEAKRNSVTA